MRESYQSGDIKGFKINKIKPLQFKRNLIEKYIDNYVTENKNKKIKTKRFQKEENKENYFIKKNPISQKKISIQEFEETCSTTLISHNLTRTEKFKNINHKDNKFPMKSRTKSWSNAIKKNNNSNISNILVYKKNILNNKSLRDTSSSINYNISFNNNSINKYERKSISSFTNKGQKDLINQNTDDSMIRTTKLKREKTFYQFYQQRKSLAKHNRYYSNNSISTNPKSNISMNKNIKEYCYLNEKNKIHKEINIEDFLLIEKKFETLKNLISDLINQDKYFDYNYLNELTNSINFHIYDLFKFYMNSSIEGSPENMFSSEKEKKIFHEYSIIFIISLGTIFLSNLLNYDLHKIIILLNIQQKQFLLLCDELLKKLNSKYNNNIWVNKLLIELNNKLIFNIYDNILQVRLLSQKSYEIINDVLNSLNKMLQINNYININQDYIQIFFVLFNTFCQKKKLDFDSIDITRLEELFNKNIFRYENKFSRTNILKDINCINNEFYDINKFDEIDTTVPYLKFPCNKEYTLILDLDETLICFKSSENNDNVGNIHIRPGLEIFLEIIKEFYEIIIFTVGTREYANIILDLIEKKNGTKYFDGRLYREHATKIGNKYIKDLSKIGRDLSRIVIVDNLSQCFKLHNENGILICSFYGEDENDNALIELQKILIKIYYDDCDVRKSIYKYRDDIFNKISKSKMNYS